MNRQQKIDFLSRYQTGKANINELKPIIIIVEHPDGKLTIDGQPITEAELLTTSKKGSTSTPGNYDLNGVSDATLKRWISILNKPVVKISANEALL